MGVGVVMQAKELLRSEVIDEITEAAKRIQLD